MSRTTFTDLVPATPITTSWLNGVDAFVYGGGGSAAGGGSAPLDSPVVGIDSFGAVGDGVTDDYAAFTAAKTDGRPVFLGSDTFLLGTAFDSGNLPMIGLGSAVNDPSGSVLRSYLDIGKKAIVRNTIRASSEYSDTPTSYTYLTDLVSFNIFHNNAAGYQQNLGDDSGGRTSVPAIFISGYHSGYGDCPGVSVHYGVSRTPSYGSLTGWTGANSAVCYDGEINSKTDNVNIYGAELHLTDNGMNRITAHGLVLDFNRANSSPSNSGAYNTVWTGVRMQTSGAYAADSGVSINGKWNVGIDFSGATLTNGAAMALKTNDKIYFGVPATTPPKWYADTLSSHYQVFDGSKFTFVVNNIPALQVSNTTVLSAVLHTMVKSFNIPSSGNTSSTVGAAGSAATLPTKPFTYLTIQIDGGSYKIPVYSA